MLNIPAGWKPIESAPKTGRTLLLGYWNSHGKWRTVRGQWMSAEYIGKEWDEPDGVEAGWFETAVEADDVPNCWPVTPSHWQPMPAPPCRTCNDQGAVGNILTAEPCPDCTPAPSAPGDAQDERQAFEAWAKRKKMPLARIGQQYDDFWVDHAWNGWQARARLSAPAAGDALALPELNADLIDILGRPNFTCIRIAQLLRLSGVEIDKKAEAEQATVIHYLLGFYLKHGSQWAEKAGEDIERLRLAAIAAQRGKGGEA